VAGGGKVAQRKVETLLRYGADVRVVAENVCEEIREQLPDEKIFVRNIADGSHDQDVAQNATADEDIFWEEEIRDAVLVVAATSSRIVNHEIAGICHRLGVPVNVVDAPGECTFLFPAVVVRGDISIGINTGGNSPIVSREIRRHIEQAVPEYYGEITAQLGQLREYVKEHFPEEKDRRALLSRTAAEAFGKERPLTEDEIRVILSREELPENRHDKKK
jgi:siroheme synthase-like protein